MRGALKELRRRSALTLDGPYATDVKELMVGEPPRPPKPPQMSEWRKKGPLVHLKPCPFCSGEAAVFHTPGSYGYYSAKTGVRCTDKHCLVKPSVAFDDEDYDWDARRTVSVPSLDQAVTAWNTRISSDPTT